MPQLAPFNLKAWIDEHRNLLQPPVGNACIWNSGFLVMVVGGPNQRTDYHVNPGEELFYQIEGDIVLKIVEGDQPRDVPIRQGEIFLLPAKVPHSPRRPANTIGLVVEQPRCSTEDHHLRWYCHRCHSIVFDEAFQPVDIGKQIKGIIDRFQGNEAVRKCKGCGTVYSA